jgi:hypothetical protein
VLGEEDCRTLVGLGRPVVSCGCVFKGCNEMRHDFQRTSESRNRQPIVHTRNGGEAEA